MSAGVQTVIAQDTATRAVRVSTRTAHPSATLLDMATKRPAKADLEAALVAEHEAEAGLPLPPEDEAKIRADYQGGRTYPTHDDEW